MPDKRDKYWIKPNVMVEALYGGGPMRVLSLDIRRFGTKNGEKGSTMLMGVWCEMADGSTKKFHSKKLKPYVDKELRTGRADRLR